MQLYHFCMGCTRLHSTRNQVVTISHNKKLTVLFLKKHHYLICSCENRVSTVFVNGKQFLHIFRIWKSQLFLVGLRMRFQLGNWRVPFSNIFSFVYQNSIFFLQRIIWVQFPQLKNLFSAQNSSAIEFLTNFFEPLRAVFSKDIYQVI